MAIKYPIVLFLTYTPITFLLYSYLQSMVNTMNLEERKSSLSSSIERKLCSVQQNTTSNTDNIQESSTFGLHHPFHPNVPDYHDNNRTELSIKDKGRDKPAEISLSSYRYVFVLAQIFHGIGASALISLGVTYLDESVSKTDAPLFIGIFEASFVLGPAIGYEVSLDDCRLISYHYS